MSSGTAPATAPASTPAPPFSLRPWPIADKKPKTLGDFIARVNVDHGGFRNLTEAQLREEIQNADGADSDRMDTGDDQKSQDQDEEDGDNADGDKEKGATIIEARDEFIRNVEEAHNTAMMATDMMSLLLTKESPVAAGSTLSTALRDMVGIGTLGATRLRDSNITDARRQDDTAVATGWRIMAINRTVDSIKDAAEQLEREMALEARYWADVLAVSDADWSVCPLPAATSAASPDQPKAAGLGVRFGFAESAPDFRNNSIAPLRRSPDGSARLDTPRAGRGCQRVRATVFVRGKVTGRSRLPKPTPADAPIAARVLEARNTVSSQELWHEMNREARTLLALDVTLADDAISYTLDKDTTVRLTLEDLESEECDKSENSLPQDHLAEAASVALHFLLSQTHRYNYNRRTHPTQPPPDRINPNPQYHLLRPLVAKARFLEASASLSRFAENLVAAFNRAGVHTASYTAESKPVSVTTDSNQGSQAHTRRSELLANSLIYTLESRVRFQLTPDAPVYVQGRGSWWPFVGHRFLVTLKPQQQPQQSSSEKPHPLEMAFPPSPEPYVSIADLLTYLREAAARALAAYLADTAAARLAGRNGSQKEAEPPVVDWVTSAAGSSAVVLPREGREVRIALEAQPRMRMAVKAHFTTCSPTAVAPQDEGASEHGKFGIKTEPNGDVGDKKAGRADSTVTWNTPSGVGGRNDSLVDFVLDSLSA